MSASLQDRIADKYATWEKLFSQACLIFNRIGKLIFWNEWYFNNIFLATVSCFEVLFAIAKVDVRIIMIFKTYSTYNSLLDLKKGR